MKFFRLIPIQLTPTYWLNEPESHLYISIYRTGDSTAAIKQVDSHTPGCFALLGTSSGKGLVLSVTDKEMLLYQSWEGCGVLMPTLTITLAGTPTARFREVVLSPLDSEIESSENRDSGGSSDHRP